MAHVKHNGTTLDTGISIVAYKAEHQAFFEKVNRGWIEKHFWMEKRDFEVLQHPDLHIIGAGGEIIIAKYNGELAGAVALKFVSNHVYEFTKMAVEERFRGKNVGRALADAAIARARGLGADKIILYSNTLLQPAITLYRTLGFKEVPLDGTYERSDIKMELTLK